MRGRKPQQRGRDTHHGLVARMLAALLRGRQQQHAVDAVCVHIPQLRRPLELKISVVQQVGS